MRTIIILAAVALAVNAIPSNDVVPESELFVDGSDPYASAKSTVQSLMEAGKSDQQCRDLATSSKKAIQDNVDADQKILDALPDGSECAKKGQDLVKSTKDESDKAAKAEKDAKTAYDKAAKADVDFGSINYNQLSPGQCGTFFNHPSYTKAKAASDAAKKKYDTAKGAATAAKQSYADAVASAAARKSRCLCKTKKEHDAAWKKVKASKSNAAIDWDTAHKVECVLDKTPVSKCKIPAEPKVTNPKITKDADAMPLTCKDTVEGVAFKVLANICYNHPDWTGKTIGKLSSGNDKTYLFNEPMNSLTVNFVGKGKVGPIPMNGKSLQEIFAANKYISSSSFISPSKWRVGGFGGQNNCNMQGFNVKSPVSYRHARVGIVMNEQNNCNSPDTMIGTGFTLSTATTGCMSGDYIGCCTNFGSKSSISTTVELIVQG